MTAPSIKEALDLKPCPFCGGEPDIRTRQDEDIWTHNTVTWTGVHCAECGIGFDWPPGAEPTAVEQWNTRATLSPPVVERREAIAPCTYIGPCGWKGDLASGLVQDEAAIRKDERERCALVVDRWSLPTVQTPSMWLVDKAGIAAAIRSARDGGAES